MLPKLVFTCDIKTTMNPNHPLNRGLVSWCSLPPSAPGEGIGKVKQPAENENESNK